MSQPNALLVMVLEGLIRDVDMQSLHDRNQITALKLGIITWSDFLEYWRNREQVQVKAPNAKAPKWAALFIFLMPFLGACSLINPRPSYNWVDQKSRSVEQHGQDINECAMQSMKVLPAQQANYYQLCMTNNGYLLTEVSK